MASMTLASAELVEIDLRTQYSELALHNEDFNEALRGIDPACHNISTRIAGMKAAMRA